jgi:hypothetical protein
MTADELRARVGYDPESGIFYGRHGRPIGMPHNAGYVTVSVMGRKWLAHRIAWLYARGEWPKVIDHINGDRGDNRLCNLREVTKRANSQNMRGAMSNSASRLIGASPDKQTGRWLSQIRIDGKKHHIGRFDTAAEAHQAYLAAKRIHHEGNTL